ncbi:MAG: hypothetical protein H6560_16300 [Lewinellaceae bacterium]|nr:hypothetical protein [Lewinellaceae bacterium]
MEFRVVKTGELEAFIRSDLYRRSTHCPISRHRARSQAANPRAEAGGPALVLAVKDEEVVGFVGFLPDRIGQESVYWNSGWWVAEEHKDIALPLFFQFLQKSRERVLLTDLTPHTEAIIRRLHFFRFREMAPGLRGYLRFNLGELLPQRRPGLAPLRPLFRMIDFKANLLLWARNALKRYPIPKEARIETINTFSDSDRAFMASHSENELTRRGPEELLWILNNPWVLPSEECAEDYSHYFFTAVADDFESRLLRFSWLGETRAILFTRQLNRNLAVPYLYFEEDILPVLVNYIYRQLIRGRCIHFTTFNQRLKAFMLENPSPFIFKKDIRRTFAYHEKLQGLIPDEVELQDGDGDVAFC